MPRPCKTDRELEEQTALLRLFETLHRLKKRQRENGDREPMAPKEARSDGNE